MVSTCRISAAAPGERRSQRWSRAASPTPEASSLAGRSNAFVALAPPRMFAIGHASRWKRLCRECLTTSQSSSARATPRSAVMRHFATPRWPPSWTRGSCAASCTNCCRRAWTTLEAKARPLALIRRAGAASSPGWRLLLRKPTERRNLGQRGSSCGHGCRPQGTSTSRRRALRRATTPVCVLRRSLGMRVAMCRWPTLVLRGGLRPRWKWRPLRRAPSHVARPQSQRTARTKTPRRDFRFH
mmetsp:Transcript_55831/g.161716  ORF Transcript_55831/g.161716 Transcript_55831/m.161716 type:complete len:242 (-) Transcript_55831:545-1270(-)